jgi:hypothetical protein
MHPTLIELMTGCWDEDPAQRPPISEITMHLEDLLREIPVPNYHLANGITGWLSLVNKFLCKFILKRFWLLQYAEAWNSGSWKLLNPGTCTVAGPEFFSFQISFEMVTRIGYIETQVSSFLERVGEEVGFYSNLLCPCSCNNLLKAGAPSRNTVGLVNV